MKTITPHLIGFAISAATLTIIFRYALTYGIENQSILLIVFSPTIYGITMFLCGWFFGRKDNIYLPIYDVGFRFHLTTYLVYNTISELWFIFDLNSKYEKIIVIYFTAIIWGGLLRAC